jgi:hypothetical protein
MKFNNLEKLRIGGEGSNMVLGVAPPRTPRGRVYRFSPNAKALPRHFVLGDFNAEVSIDEERRARMKLTPRSDRTVCPYSGIAAPDGEFMHPDDLTAAIETVKHAAVADAKSALQDMLQRSFSGSKYIKVRATGSPSQQPKPRFMREDLLRELVCDHCARDYGVYAIALFCPDCGAPNLRLHFHREAELVNVQADLAEAQTEINRELAYRLLGNAHEDVLTAFEATLKTVYLYMIDRRQIEAFKPVRNDFQNVEIARKRFAELGVDPFVDLTKDELDMLKLNIQKRHIIGHNLGVVDEKFAEHANEARIGETVRLLSDDVKLFTSLAQKVVDNLDKWVGT